MGDDDLLTRLLLSRRIGPDWLVPAVRVVAGLILVAVSLSKFTRHQDLVEAFERYAIPAPDASVYLAGAVELLGGLALVAGAVVRVSGAVVTFNMTVALFTGGLVDRDLYHLGLGGLLLVAAGFVTYAGAGRWSVDEALLARRAGAAGGPGGGSAAGSSGSDGADGGPAGTMPTP